MSVINTNYLSLVAQNNLQKSQSSLGTAIERLSSGLRINSAKDDAAGQAIANRMGSQINGLNQAARNANDGISAAQTTEGALNQINDNLQRIRVLTVQAETGTNSEEDLTSIQNEIGQRLDEINRISTETEFNGVNVLAEDNTLSIQVGANDGQVIEIDLQKINVASLSLQGFNVNGQGEIANAAATEADIKLADNVVTSAGPGDYTLQVQNTEATASDVLAQLADADTVEVTDDAAGTTPNLLASNFGFGSGDIDGTFTSDGEGNVSFDVADLAEADAASYIAGSADGPTRATYTNTSGSQDILIDSAGSITDADGNQLYIDTGTGNLSLNNAGGATTVAATADELADFMGDAAAGTATLAIDGGPTLTSNANAASVDVTGASLSNAQFATYADDADLFIQTTVQSSGTTPSAITINADGSVTDADADSVYVNADGALVDQATTDTELFVRENGNITDDAANQYFVDQQGNLTTEAVTTGERTENPLDVLDTALAQVDALRSDLGAIQNRFESAITNLQTTSNNLSAAQSRIQDADYSVEVANMTRAQILQQAGTSVLAQANQIPQGVLSLLG